MPKWEQYLAEEDTPTFEKFDKTIKTGRRLLKKGEDLEEKKRKELQRDEERTAKRRTEV